MTGKKSTLLILQANVFLFSIAGLCSKLAAGQPVWSLRFWGFYGLSLCILLIYAVVWQQILKKLPITIAYACKGMSAVWAMMWGICIFGETIRPKLLLSAAVIAAGVGLVVSNDT